MAETRGFEPLDDITIIDYLVGSCFKPDSAMFPKKMEHRADLETASIALVPESRLELESPK